MDWKRPTPETGGRAQDPPLHRKPSLTGSLLLLLSLLFAGPSLGAQPDPLAALAAGNQAAGAGQLEAAVEAYLRGYDPQAIHPTLAYNLGTTLHQLGRLPEAILWYRRAAPTAGTADPWLADNLLLARRTLGSQNAGHPGLFSELDRNASWLTAGAILLSFLGAGVFLLLPRSRLPAFVLLALALALQLSALAGFELAAKEAVLLRDCVTGAGTLPAGSELWVQPEGPDYRVAGSRDAVCQADSLVLVYP